MVILCFEPKSKPFGLILRFTYKQVSELDSYPQKSWLPGRSFVASTLICPPADLPLFMQLFFSLCLLSKEMDSLLFQTHPSPLNSISPFHFRTTILFSSRSPFALPSFDCVWDLRVLLPTQSLLKIFRFYDSPILWSLVASGIYFPSSKYIFPSFLYYKVQDPKADLYWSIFLL